MFLVDSRKQVEGKGSRIHLAFLLLLCPSALWLHHLAAGLSSPDGPSTRQEVSSKPANGRRLSCSSNETEFTCSINNICIPIEWRCDFIEHCLDGQDEFGCLSEWCDFGRDLCNWFNQVPEPAPTGHPEVGSKSNTASPTNTYRNRVLIWRRHSNRNHKKLNTFGGLRPTKEGLEIIERLDWLRDKLDPNFGFVFVPLSLSSRFLTSANDNSTTSSSPSTHNNTNSNNNNPNNNPPKKSWRLEAKSSRLVAPYLGRTSSACQLKFKYVLWSNIMKPHYYYYYNYNHYTTTTSASTNKQPKLNISLTLKLIERQTEAPEPLSWRPVGSGGGGGELHERVVWQKTVDTSNSPTSRPPLPQAKLPPEDQRLGDWLIGIAELGRSKQIELYFEASLVARLSAEEAAQLQLLEQARREQGEPRLMHASMVALTELSFQSCAWYQTYDTNRLEQPSLVLDDEWELDAGTGLGSSEEEEQVEEETRHRKQQQQQCIEDDFRCSNGICVPSYRLCNFQDDCMADGQRPEDEAPSLCAGVPGMQDFEASGLKASHFFSSQPSSSTNTTSSTSPNSTTQWPAGEGTPFWSLTSNWPKESISVQNSIRGAAHLPLRDHTLRSPRGHYLSFELPRLFGHGTPTEPLEETSGKSSVDTQSSRPTKGEREEKEAQVDDDNGVNNNNNSESNNIFWIYLDSPWMRKKGAISPVNNSTPTHPPRGYAAECRVKFFYNIVVDNPWALEVAYKILPFRIYLALEHFVLVQDSVDKIVSHSRELDMFTHSNLLEIESSMLARSDGFIEYLGTDFWRETNYKLRNLNEGDLFYLRVSIIVEPSETLHLFNNIRVTINLDDLATHFGCAQLYENSKEELKHYHQGWGFNLTNYFRSSSPASSGEQHNTNRRLLTKSNTLATVQFEPQRLIIYVLLVLSGIIGLILLIVFVTVPFVERSTINYYDQFNSDLSNMSDAVGPGSALMLERDGTQHICQLSTVSGLEESWQRIGGKSDASSRLASRHSSALTMSDC